MMTKLNKMLKLIRIQNGEVLKDMADRLGVTSSYLSAVELGKRPMPPKWSEALRYEYGLDVDQVKELQSAADQLVQTIKLEVRDTSKQKKETAIVFARAFDDMDDDMAKNIRKMLMGGE